jgi:hypothetical protein
MYVVGAWQRVVLAMECMAVCIHPGAAACEEVVPPRNARMHRKMHLELKFTRALYFISLKIII